MPHRRYHGRTGVITGFRGRCFEVKVKIGKAEKTLIIGKHQLNQVFPLRPNNL